MKKNEFMENVSEIFDETSNDKNANVNVIKSKKKANVNEDFVIFFFEKFSRSIINSKISMSDLLVLLKVLEYVSWGNVINLTQQTVADDLNMKQQQVNRSFKKLEKACIFIRAKKSLFINPNYMCMGDLNKSTESEAYKTVFNRKYKELDDILPEDQKPELHKKAQEAMSYTKA
jgi:predicted transcriptional regulator